MTTSQVAVLFPAVLFWLMLIVQYGLWWHAKQVADAAAADGAAAARVPTGTEEDGTAAVQAFLAQAGNLDDVEITVDREPRTVTVTVTGSAPRLVPGFGWSVQSSATVPLEQFLDPSDR